LKVESDVIFKFGFTLNFQFKNILRKKSTMNHQNEIILYQPNNAIEVEVRIENETVWLTQTQIAKLFGVKQPAISKHLKNIFSSGELSEYSVYSILEYTAADGKVYRTGFYNLDTILSIGYLPQLYNVMCRLLNQNPMQENNGIARR